ncbi:hypothetical protein NHX12_006485 [Muraenolepis orangiensis]|uniref:RNA-binding protein 27 n=1 Tax=Muraenolepis orangiensis TaxID=630683 RepID=A0A9Q0DV68_9TELE|nr:hypothetical protein NHX12_006485 [Muraenolepis orangiensis]
MIIENLDALKSWLSKTLEPICDADPSALAKYVVALVKKDKNEKELKALCLDQLDVFLQKDTQVFVDKLFEALSSRNYLPPSEGPNTKTHIKPEKDELKKEESSREDDRDKRFSRRLNHSPPLPGSRYSRDNRRVEDRGKRDERPRKRERYRELYQRDGGAKPKYDHEAADRSEVVDGFAPPPLVPTATTSQFLVPGPPPPPRGPPPQPRKNNSTTETWSDHAFPRKRCRDYDASHLSQVLLPPSPPCSSVISSVTSSVPTIVTSGGRSSLPTASAPLFSSDSYETDMYNPEAPSITSMSRPLQYRHRPNVQRPNLIGLTMGDMDQPHRERPPNQRVVMESDPRKRPADGNMAPKKPWFTKPSFGNQQGCQGSRAPPQFHPPNARLLVRPVPPELNNISKLNTHFSQFGTIVNLQVAYQSDPEAALVQFSSPSEAKRAIQSPEAVLGNRFISVHWYRQDGPSASLQPANPHDLTALPISLKQSVKDRLGPLLSGPSEPPHHLTDASQNSAKMSVKERLGFPVKPSLPVEKVFSTSKGLTKTVFNPAALKTPQRSSEELLKKKQEALRLQQDVQKKKQQILENHIQTQKLLISKLDQKKVLRVEDRAEIMQTLSSLTQIITKLQEEIKASSSTSHTSRSAKTKAQAQKELLDTELDLFKRGQAGEDTALLKIKYTQLQIEAAKRGLLARGRGLAARGRGSLRSRGRGSRGRGRCGPLHVMVDHRPRALEISGFSDAERIELLPHFAQFGDIEDCRMDEETQSAVITFRSRAEAAVHGMKLSALLRLSWYKPPISMTTADHGLPEPDDDEFQEESMSDEALLQDDDEEEDDNEPRSWRR